MVQLPINTFYDSLHYKSHELANCFSIACLNPSNETNFSFLGSKEALEWKVRYKIGLGIAEGLLYLHERCHRHIIHRDIKASNILLTDDYQPQV